MILWSRGRNEHYNGIGRIREHFYLLTKHPEIEAQVLHHVTIEEYKELCEMR